MKIGVILGTRPEIIKLSSIIRKLENDGTPYFIIHTNQHFSANMDTLFFEELELPTPHYNLNTETGSHANVTASMLVKIEDILLEEKPDVVLVQGDTNTVLAGALAASKIGVKIGHVESGLRSYDRSMPEELNRILTDSISDYLFAPTSVQEEILLNEGNTEGKVHVVGNTVVDAVEQCVVLAENKSQVLETLETSPEEFILLTSHRPATVDNEKHLKIVLDAASTIGKEHDKKILFPIHPRTKGRIEQFKIDVPDNIHIFEPVGYLDMLLLLKEAFLVITDSGGLQEEACILQTKCVVIRENTERPEAVEVGGAILAGNSDVMTIAKKANEILQRPIEWYNPFGDGASGVQIINILSADH